MAELAAAPARAYRVVLDLVEDRILDGSLKVGDRLPAERYLAASLQVSRAAVREAIRTLEAQGVVRAGVGSGPEAGTVVTALPSAALNRLLRLHVALGNFALDDVVDSRVMLERSSVALAAEHGTPPARAGLLALLDELEATADRAAYNELDAAFHIALAEAGGNRLMADMTAAIRDSTRRPILRGLEALGEDWLRVRAGLNAEHREIYAAVAAGRPARAADLVEAHIRGAARWL
ncbi:MAG: FCD domain-containing protein [Nocardioides sp.]|uniref:FadR/GntR family transcriptional regulator n=1 Tax=Nocardioides sp. TaxID=35761 RepID=UPI0039E59152